MSSQKANMKITCDLHLHSRHSCDTRKGSMEELVAQAKTYGLKEVGFADHLHTPFNLPDLVASREEFLTLSCCFPVHFGCEVSCVSQWELDEIAAGKVTNPVYGIREGGPPGGPMAIGLTLTEKQKLGIEYVIGGVHWMLYEPVEPEEAIRSYHRQNLFLASHPLVDIIAHPWWWQGAWRDSNSQYHTYPWFDDFHRIPRQLHEEFIRTVKKYGKKVEINLSAMLLNPRYSEHFKGQYLEYLQLLKEKGIRFTIGSDCHGSYHSLDMEKAQAYLEAAGFSEEDFWRPENSGRQT